MFAVRGRFSFLCGALLVLANVALGDGTYQRTKDGKTFVWNNHPKPGDEATWSGGRDRERYARGFGTLTWYTVEQGSGTASAKPALYARYWGNMVRGKLSGPVNVHSQRKTDHAIFLDGVRMTRWAFGPASSRAGAEWRAIVQRSEVRGPAAASKLRSEISAEVEKAENAERPTSNVQRPMAEMQPEPPAEGPRSAQAVARAESAQLSANARAARTGPPKMDVDDSLWLLAWPPPFLGMRSMNRGSLVRARLTKEEVVDLADAAARSRGYDPTGYQRPEPQYDPSDQAWSLLYDENPADGTVGKHLSVAVGDKTRRTAVVSGK